MRRRLRQNRPRRGPFSLSASSAPGSRAYAPRPAKVYRNTRSPVGEANNWRWFGAIRATSQRYSGRTSSFAVSDMLRLSCHIFANSTYICIWIFIIRVKPPQRNSIQRACKKPVQPIASRYSWRISAATCLFKIHPGEKSPSRRCPEAAPASHGTQTIAFGAYII